eukprot:1653794-Lingulodinium_polyedra.AAC.1
MKQQARGLLPFAGSGQWSPGSRVAEARKKRSASSRAQASAASASAAQTARTRRFDHGAHADAGGQIE